MQTVRYDLPIVSGTTYRDTVRLMQPVYRYADIQSIVGAPVVLTARDHGITSDWPVWLRSIRGVLEFNREPQKQQPYRAQVLDDDRLEINALSAVGQRPEGGQLVYRAPVDLTGADLSMTFAKNGDVLLFLELGAGLTVSAPGSITRRLAPEQTALLAVSGVSYQFDVTFPDGTVSRYLEGSVLCP